ncbi:hypothetical protein FY128_23395 (plasmid) [Agrobacterium tumefaciens]|nr:hypothetical protein FY128_23395 [Agrobacterium tumefaciens]
MLAATFIATFFIPMFYRLITWRERKHAVEKLHQDYDSSDDAELKPSHL